MKRLAFSAVVLFACVAACGDDETPPGSAAPAGGGGGGGGGPSVSGPTGLLEGRTVTAAGETRSYDMFVPERSDDPRGLPLVFVFHGDGGTGAGVRKTFGLEAVAGDAAIFVYPDGRDRSWDLDDPADRNPDIAFFDAIVVETKKSYPVDAGRIFATGYSSGAYFANQLGCRRGAVLRAVATHAGGGPYGGDSEYDDEGNLVCPEPPVAALVIHGTDDGTVALSEGESSRDHWRRVNGCTQATEAYAPEPCVKYAGCAERPVVWCAVPGVGHVVWPGEGAKTTWSFFASL